VPVDLLNAVLFCEGHHHPLTLAARGVAQLQGVQNLAPCPGLLGHIIDSYRHSLPVGTHCGQYLAIKELSHLAGRPGHLQKGQLRVCFERGRRPAGDRDSRQRQRAVFCSISFLCLYLSSLSDSQLRVFSEHSRSLAFSVPSFSRSGGSLRRALGTLGLEKLAIQALFLH